MFNKYLKGVFLIIILFMLCSCEEDVYIHEDELEKNDSIMINITGKVKFPGIYEVQSEKYLYEIIDLAGGLLDTANTNDLNLVQLIDRSCTIHIKGLEVAKESALININYASAEQLMLLPGIGEVYANKIIEYRISNGLFLNIEDIKLIPGIKESVFEKIKHLITI